MLPSEDAIFVSENYSSASAYRSGNSPSPQPMPTVSPSPGPAYHAAFEDSGVQLVLSRHRGRKLHHAEKMASRNLAAATSGRLSTRRLQPKFVSSTTVAALEQALAPGDVACVLAEPVMTNVGIVHPDPGYHQALRELTEKFGTLLIIDETPTICAGPGGYTRAENLDPDFFIFGKAIGGGVPGAAYDSLEAVADAIAKTQNSKIAIPAHWRNPRRKRSFARRHAGTLTKVSPRTPSRE